MAPVYSSKNLRNTINGYLTYENKFGNHSVKVWPEQHRDAEYIYQSARRNGVYDFDKGEVNLSGGDPVRNIQPLVVSVAASSAGSIIHSRIVPARDKRQV